MRALAFIAALLSAGTAYADTLPLEPTEILEWKAVFGRVEARDTVPARARIGGIVVSLDITEGDLVKAGQKIATVRDDKLNFQIEAFDAQLEALQSQLRTATTDFERAEGLASKGVIAPQRRDQLRTQVEVLTNEITATEAKRAVIRQQQAEGDVIAPAAGRVLSVPITKGAVIMGGETIATIGGGGFFLRLAIPERHALALKQGSEIQIDASDRKTTGRLAKIYPQIENGRVIADVEVDALSTAFVGARMLVQVPVGKRKALIVPRKAIATRSGIDFVRVMENDTEVERAVVLGQGIDGGDNVEVLTGLMPGDLVSIP